MTPVGIKELQTMDDVSEASFVSYGVLRENGGNQFRNVMYSFMETGQFPKEVLPVLYQVGFMQLLNSHVFKTVQSVWFWFTFCVAHKLAPNALVFWSHFGKNCYTCRGSYCYAVRLPLTLSTLHQFVSPGTVLLVVSDLPVNIRY